jgi:hypothetical protein
LPGRLFKLRVLVGVITCFLIADLLGVVFTKPVAMGLGFFSGACLVFPLYKSAPHVTLRGWFLGSLLIGIFGLLLGLLSVVRTFNK